MQKFTEMLEKLIKTRILCYKTNTKIWDVNVDSIVISKLIGTKSNAEYFIEH